ncbi:MAG: hypothetical protein R2865_14090 [Deinococcales bacterium]
MGDLLFYEDNATARGESYSYQRYAGIEELNKIPCLAFRQKCSYERALFGC